MKKNILLTSLITISLFCLTLMIACKKNKITDTSYGINAITNPDMVNKGLRLSGKLIKGGLPHSNGSGSGGVLIVSNPQAVEVSAGVDVFIPYSTNIDSSIAKLFVQVEGADSYWEIPARVNGATTGPLAMKIFIPNFVQKGNFNLIYSVEDKNGKISPSAKTNTLVSSALGCNAAAHGSVGITVRTFDLGTTSGLVTIDYNTYSIPDRVDVQHNGKWCASTGKITKDYFPECTNYSSGADAGFVSGTGTLNVDYNAGDDRYLVVYVTGCDNGTAWDVTVNCPVPDTRTWYEKLPDCPCNWSDAQKLIGKTYCPEGEWGIPPNAADQDYHYGSVYELRWYPEIGGTPGQQCNYDQSQKLITNGLAAGSADSVSPKDFWSFSNNYVCSHYKADIIPWGDINPTWSYFLLCGNGNSKIISCKDYMNQRPTNKGEGNGCSGVVTVSSINHCQNMVTLIGEMNCKQATILIKNATLAPTGMIDEDLRGFISKGTYQNLTKPQLITKLQFWHSNLDPTTDIAMIIGIAINNLQ